MPSSRISLPALLITTAAFLTAGCAPPVDTQHGNLVQSAKSRDTFPNASAADLAELVAGNSEFALDLYRSLSTDGGNLFYSPYSISIALAMTYAGANGQTASQMAETLHYTLPQDRLHPAFNTLDLLLESRGQGAAGSDGEGFRLNIANAIWGQQDYNFLPEFLDVLAVNYGAGLRTLDFITDPESARLTINDWVSIQTEQRIRDLLAPRTITPLTRLVLTNAVYFNAAWMYPFDEADTHNGPFYLIDGSQISTPMMSRTEFFNYAQGDGYQAVELPYDGAELSMVILLPDAGEFQQFEDAIAGSPFTAIDAILESLQTTNVHLTMPKFTYESEFNLNETLAALGMPDAFCGGNVDFSGMNGNLGLCVSNVVHKAFVKVDEAGTEAAAATAVIVGETSIGDPTQAVSVTVDRPFLFLIRDIQTEEVLFMGRVITVTPP